MFNTIYFYKKQYYFLKDATPLQINIIPSFYTRLVCIHDAHLPTIYPSSIVRIVLSNHYNGPLDMLPHHIREVVLGTDYNHTLSTLPNHITHLSTNNYFNHTLKDIPANITHIELGHSYNQITSLPPYLISLKCGYNYNQPTILPSTIRFVEFGQMYNVNTILPHSIIQLTVINKYIPNNNWDLPSGITYFMVGKVQLLPSAKCIQHVLSSYNLVETNAQGILYEHAQINKHNIFYKNICLLNMFVYP